MNWYKKYSKKLFITLLILFMTVGMCFCEVLTGEIRKEYKQREQKIITIPEKKISYSAAAILAYNKGIEFYRISDFDKAIDSFKSAVKQEPHFADAYFNLGILYDYFENPKDAIIAFNRAYVINKKDYEALYYMIKCYVLLGDNVAAKYYSLKMDKESAFYEKVQELLN